ncbi:unnamed protein product, partial [Mesorhabditis spiculigera]
MQKFTPEQRAEIDRIENAALNFRNMRVQYGFTQYDVGLALGRRYGGDFSQTTISRYEACNLTFQNMRKLTPIFDVWINEAAAAIRNGTTVSDIIEHGAQLADIGPQPGPSVNIKKRKRRAVLDLTQQNALELAFCCNNNPTRAKTLELATTHGLDTEVVRVWFCNRRQKRRRGPDDTLADRVPSDEGTADSEMHIAKPEQGSNLIAGFDEGSKKYYYAPCAPIEEHLPKDEPITDQLAYVQNSSAPFDAAGAYDMKGDETLSLNNHGVAFSRIFG